MGDMAKRRAQAWLGVDTGASSLPPVDDDEQR